MINPKDMLDKAKEMAGKDPEKTREYIDKAEDMIDERTGGKYASQVDQGGDVVEGQLGLGEERPPAR